MNFENDNPRKSRTLTMNFTKIISLIQSAIADNSIPSDIQMEFTSVVLLGDETPETFQSLKDIYRSIINIVKENKNNQNQKENKTIFSHAGKTFKDIYQTIKAQQDIRKWFSSTTNDTTKGAMLEAATRNKYI